MFLFPMPKNKFCIAYLPKPSYGFDFFDEFKRHISGINTKSAFYFFLQVTVHSVREHTNFQNSVFIYV